MAKPVAQCLGSTNPDVVTYALKILHSFSLVDYKIWEEIQIQKYLETLLKSFENNNNKNTIVVLAEMSYYYSMNENLANYIIDQNLTNFIAPILFDKEMKYQRYAVIFFRELMEVVQRNRLFEENFHHVVIDICKLAESNDEQVLQNVFIILYKLLHVKFDSEWCYLKPIILNSQVLQKAEAISKGNHPWLETAADAVIYWFNRSKSFEKEPCAGKPVQF